MKSSTALRSLALAGAALIASLACGGSSTPGPGASSGPPIKIGAINPYHGPTAKFGEDLVRGNQLAVDEVNAKGGINGRKVQLVKGDATNALEGTQEVTRLATQENVDLFTGTYLSAVATTASETAGRYKKLYWDTNAVAQSLTDRDLPNFIRSGPAANNLAQGAVDSIVDIATKQLNKQPSQIKVWLEYEDGPYGTSVKDGEKTQLAAKGYQIAGTGGHSAAATDLTDSVLRAQKADPDVVAFVGYVPDSTLFMKKMREQNFSPKALILIGTGDTQETVDALGPKYIEGIVVVSFPRPDIINAAYAPGGLAYLAAYRKQYNQDPAAPQTLSGYVGMKMLLEVLAKAGSTEVEKVRKAAQSMDRPIGTYANGWGMKFDEHFQNVRAGMVEIQWQSGKQVTVLPEKARMPGTQVLPLARPAA